MLDGTSEAVLLQTAEPQHDKPAWVLLDSFYSCHGRRRATIPTMDITKFVVSSREKALLYGDYATYRTQLVGRLLNCRKKLNIATKHRGKFHQKAQPTPEQLAENHE